MRESYVWVLPRQNGGESLATAILVLILSILVDTDYGVPSVAHLKWCLSGFLAASIYSSYSRTVNTLRLLYFYSLVITEFRVAKFS